MCAGWTQSLATGYSVGVALDTWLSLSYPQSLPHEMEIVMPIPQGCCKDEKCRTALLPQTPVMLQISLKSAFSGSSVSPVLSTPRCAPAASSLEELTWLASFSVESGTSMSLAPRPGYCFEQVRGWVYLCLCVESMCSPNGWTFILKKKTISIFL